MSDVVLGEFSTDVTPPVVTDPYPLPPDYAFPRDYVVQFRITDTEAGVDTANMLITLDGAVAYDGTDVGNEWQVGYTGNITDEGGGALLVEILTHPDFDSYATVNVTVDAQDLAPLPNVMDQYSWSFETEDFEPPYVDAGYAPEGLGVPVSAQVQFHLKDDGTGVDLTSVLVTIGGVEAYNWDGSGDPNTGFQGEFAAGSLVTGTPNDYTFSIDKTPDYAEWTTYEVRVDADDLAEAGPIVVATFDGGSVTTESFGEWSSGANFPFVEGEAEAEEFDGGSTTTESFSKWSS